MLRHSAKAHAGPASTAGLLVVGIMALHACSGASPADDSAQADTDPAIETGYPFEIPGHSECLPEGESMTDEVCLAVVEVDGRYPGTSENKSGAETPQDDPRIDDPDLAWLKSEIERCTCVCCHKTSYGGPGVYFYDLEFAPVWIDSASNWSLGVMAGFTTDEEQTLPSTDRERLVEVIERERERRRTD